MLSPHARQHPATTPRAGDAAIKATKELLSVLLPATDPLPYDMGKTKVHTSILHHPSIHPPIG